MEAARFADRRAPCRGWRALLLSAVAACASCKNATVKETNGSGTAGSAADGKAQPAVTPAEGLMTASPLVQITLAPKGSDADFPERGSLAAFTPSLVSLAGAAAVAGPSGAAAPTVDPFATPDPPKPVPEGWKRIEICHKFDSVESENLILVGAMASTLGGKYTAGMVQLEAIPLDTCVPVGNALKAFGVLVLRKAEWLAASPENRRFELKDVSDLTWVNEWPWAAIPADGKLKGRTVHYAVASEGESLSFKRVKVIDSFEDGQERETDFP